MINNGKKTLKDRIFDLLELPQEMAGGESFVYYRIGGELCLKGCGEILKYENEEIIIRTQKNNETVTISGEMLTMKTYYQSDMIIKGRINGIMIGTNSL